MSPKIYFPFSSALISPALAFQSRSNSALKTETNLLLLNSASLLRLPRPVARVLSSTMIKLRELVNFEPLCQLFNFFDRDSVSGKNLYSRQKSLSDKPVNGVVGDREVSTNLVNTKVLS